MYQEGWIEKSVVRITIWHHDACRVMTNSAFEGDPHTNNGFYFLRVIKPRFFIDNKRLVEVPVYTLSGHTLFNLQKVKYI